VNIRVTCSSLIPAFDTDFTPGVDWDFIAQQYDEIIKYTAALRTGTAEPEAIF